MYLFRSAVFEVVMRNLSRTDSANRRLHGLIEHKAYTVLVLVSHRSLRQRSTIKAQGAFVTVSCGTPFAISAGVGFSTIEQKQFAIVQSPDGKSGTINTFGTSSDSKINPVALAHV
jgi:hypothetical protein